MIIGLFQKKSEQWGLRTYFITLPLVILDKTKFYPYEFDEIVLHPLEIPRPKMKT